MASKATIVFNFNQAKQQADKLDALADNLSNMSSTEFSAIMQTVSANWKGENATAYLAKGSTLQERMNETAKSLRGIASEIRTVARRIYNAEMAALALAEKRTY